MSTLYAVTTARLDARVGDPSDELEYVTPGQESLLLLNWADGQIGNGGMWQFVENNTGTFVDRYGPVATRVGADAHAAVVDDLLGVLGVSTLPRDQEERLEVLQEISDTADEEGRGGNMEEALDALDRRWYALEEDPATNLDSLVWNYARTHREEFFVSEDEAHAEEELLLTEIKRAAADAPPPLGMEGVRAAERQLGFTLPRLLGRLFAEVGDGGWGPPPGAAPLAAVVELYEEFDWPDRAVPVINIKDTRWRAFDCSRPAAPWGRLSTDHMDRRLWVDGDLHTLMELWLAGRLVY